MRFAVDVAHAVAFLAEDGLLPSEATNSFLAYTRFARPNRLNNCVVFLTRPR